MLFYGEDRNSKKCVHIRHAKNGIVCNCVCPICGSDLVAHQGSIREWHFQHNNKNECRGALETLLHRRAKEILSSSMYLLLPILEISEQASYLDEGDEILQSSHLVLVEHEERLLLDKIKLIECWVNTVRPDLIVYTDGVPLLIEIAVTHFVDSDKRKKIEKLNISCIEIDLSFHRNQELTDSEFERLLLVDVVNKNWIHHANEREVRISKKKELVSVYGSNICYVNKEPDGIKYGHDYSALSEQYNFFNYL